MNYNLKQLTNKQLDFINERVISPDKHMFEIKAAGGGFNTVIASKIIEYILANCTTFNKDSVVLTINDFSLHMTKALIEYGISAKHIKLVFCRFSDKKEIVIEDKTLIKLFRLHPVLRQNKELEIISWEEVDHMKFDGIIANPPYGAIGANITKKIIDTVDFKEFIELLPANDYKRNKDKDLFNYQSDMEAINDGFADAAVTTHVAKIHKNKVNNMTLDEFERSNYIDRQLDKYFEVNHSRKHYAIDVEKSNLTMTDIITGTINNLFLFSERDCSHHHMPYSKTCAHYRWNILEDVDTDWIKTNYVGVRQTKDGIGITKFHGIIFGTHAEKLNFANFIFKNNNGFKFISKLFTAMNKDGTDGYRNCFPKVDWTRSWTVEEILADYGYTETEIQVVMDDLKNFKGMED